MEEFDFYEINDWEIMVNGMSSNMLHLLAHNPHPFATTLLETNIEKLSSDYLVIYGQYLINSHTETNNKLALYNRLKKIHESTILPYSHTSSLICKTYTMDTITSKGTWIHGYNIDNICKRGTLEQVQKLDIHDRVWSSLCLNPNPGVVEFVAEKNRIVWSFLSRNSSDMAANYLEAFPQFIDWHYASQNMNDKITRHFPAMKHKLSIIYLCKNTSDNVVNFLLNDPEMYSMIDWALFCSNSNEYAVEHIYKLSLANDRRICWDYLCANENKNVFRILRNNQDRIVWHIFIKNPICFEYDYEKMRLRMTFKEELDKVIYSPEKIMHLISVCRTSDESDFEVISKIDF